LISVLELIVRVAASSMFSIQKHFLYPLFRYMQQLRWESTDQADQIWYLPQDTMDVGEEFRHFPIPTCAAACSSINHTCLICKPGACES